jgi:hypothetical protein
MSMTNFSLLFVITLNCVSFNLAHCEDPKDHFTDAESVCAKWLELESKVSPLAAKKISKDSIAKDFETLRELLKVPELEKKAMSILKLFVKQRYLLQCGPSGG